MEYLLIERPYPRGQKIHVRSALPASWTEIARRPSLLIARASLGRGGFRCHNKGNTLRQQQQQLADILVQVLPNDYVACCRVGGSRGGGGWWLCRVHVLVLILYFIASAASSSTRVSGFGVVRWCLTLSFSVGARYQKTRVLLRARRLRPLRVAAASGGVRHKCQNYMQ